ncbi:MAG: hypothetical protein JSW61_02960 [Candidatus Thorarchaeota archaeon]|nr:MAG: hypothetical protein JSW61_02960 [Candidatus Thorarchaeota archaeon]
MSDNWSHIAKAEFLAITSRFRHRRKRVATVLMIVCPLWAIVVAPWIVSSLLILWFGSEYTAALKFLFPGMMRSLVLMIWIILFLGPISAALQEIKIGQWEILLSHNVKTRDILVGSFLAGIPVYGLFVIVAAPVVLGPLVVAYEVSIFGQLLIYSVIFFVTISAVWLSLLLGTALQSKLGRSERGRDIATAFSVITGLLILLAIYVVQLVPAEFAAVMQSSSMDWLPSSWGADLVTWIAVMCNGVGLSASDLRILGSMLGFGPSISFILLMATFVGTIGLALFTSDRLFRIEAGARTETVVTTGRENLILRGLRRLSSSSFTVLVITSLKDFGRKAQNVTSLGFGMILAIVFPLMINYSVGATDPDRVFFYFIISSNMMLSIVGAITFGGIAFMESKNHLWIIKSTPDGVFKYVKARIAQSLLLAIPVVFIYTIIASKMMAFGLVQSIGAILGCCMAISGAVMISTGVTANNPNYEDRESKIFRDNTGAIMVTLMVSILGSALGLGLLTGFENLALLAYGPGVVLMIVGLSMVYVGAKRLALPD